MLPSVKKYTNWILCLLCITILFIVIYSLKLCSENRVERFEGNQKTLAFFGAKWCPHCVKFKKTWDQLESDNVILNHLEFTNKDNKKYFTLHNVKSFPTLLLLPHGIDDTKGSIPYKGPRDAESIIAFLKAN